MRYIAILVFIIIGIGAMEAMAFHSEEITVDKVNYFLLESDKLLLYFNRQGGRLDRVYYKSGKMDFINPAYRGAFTENDWNKNQSRNFLYKRMFNLTYEQNGDEFSVICRGHHMGGGIDFLEVTKQYIIRRGSPVITVKYDFYNQPAAMSKVLYSLHIHTGLTLIGESDIRYYMPGEDGIKNNSGWQNAPSRGWLAADSPGGTGFALSMDFPTLQNFLIWGKNTMEWRYIPQFIGNGEHFRTEVELIPFNGLPLVSGAGNGVVGALIHEREVASGSTVPVEVRVFSGKPDKFIGELYMRRSSGETWKMVGKEELDIPAGDGFAGFSTEVADVEKGSVELEAVIYRKDKELARLNSRIICEKESAPWRIDLLEIRNESSVDRVDLTLFTHVQPDSGAIPWAKPLPDGKIRVLALLPQIAQFGDIANRLDMSFAMSWIVQNRERLAEPTWLLCDYYGAANMKDVMDNIRKVLEADYDVIFIGGISWRLLPEDIRESILAKITRGTGLVYTGVDEGHEFMKLTGKWRNKPSMEKPVAVKNSFLTAGVPFAVFPESGVYSLGGDGEIHAKAGTFPYIVSSSLGKGKIVGYCYAPNIFHSGIIPYDPAGPYYVYRTPTPYEFYFSMLAKGIMYAAGRKPSFDFVGFEASHSAGKLVGTWKIASEKEQAMQWEYFIMDRNNEVRSRGMADVAMREGIQNIELDIPFGAYAGEQTISAIARNGEGEVLNWGTWRVSKEPGVKIISVESDRKNYCDGEVISYEVKFSKTLDKQQLRVELEDSYGRILDRREGEAGQIAGGSFKYHNMLPSRYAKIRAYLLENGQEIDTGGCYFHIRPAERLLRWDDYMINSIIYWTGADFYYRMPRTAQVYRQLGVDILMNCWGLDHVLLNNFAPQGYAPNSIGSQNFPADEYLKTGNKLLLARKNCISDDKRNAALRKRWKDNGQKGYRLGVQFYDTGDELALSRAGRPVEFCFSEHCLRNFREFLEKRYGSLEKLNQAWDCSFGSWNEVMPFTKEEVWAANGKHVAGWADHREFMDDLCYRHLKSAIDEIRRHDPGARLSSSGSMAPNAYGGLDWWKLMQVFDCLQHYNEFLHDEILRSFGREGYAAIPWYVGYGCKGQEQVYKIWRSAFVGSSGISLWCLHSGILFPDLTLQSGISDALPHLKNLKNGTGKLLMNCLKPRPAEVAILYSQASLRAAFIEKRMDIHRELWGKYIRLCRNFGVEFKFISYEQLANGVLDDSSFKLLIMPDSSALSDAEVGAVERYFTNGGCVLAEGVPATRYANCVKRSAGALTGIFRKSRGRAVILDEPDVDYNLLMAAPDSKLNFKQLRSEQKRFESRLKASNIDPRPFKLLHLDGSPVIEAEYYLRRGSGGEWFAGIITGNPLLKQVKISLPKAGYVYNLVDGKRFGNGTEFTLDFQQGLPIAIVVMPQENEIENLSVTENKVSLNLTASTDTVINIRVTAPGNIERAEYGKNILAVNGVAQYTIPFVISDPAGEWLITAREIISGKTNQIKINR